MTLCVMAGGMGRRFGGDKQIEPIDDKGRILMDFSLDDAICAGFKNAVFVIRRDIEKEFNDKFLSRVRGKIRCTVVFQETPKWRTKPLGTTSALMSARDAINEPFCVINADDYYGYDAFKKMYKYLRRHRNGNALVAYKLKNTLSRHGSVSRGVISKTRGGWIRDIREQKFELGATFPENTLVSVNCFAFSPTIFNLLERQYNDFLLSLDRDPDKECFLPDNVGTLVKNGDIRIKVLKTRGEWLGMTYRADKVGICARLAGR